MNYWEALDSNDSTESQNSFSANWKVVGDIYGKLNRKIISDPTNTSTKVIEITYPAGSNSPKGSIIGGSGVYANPLPLSTATTINLEYKVYFPPAFNFVLGGKLPGLYGGKTSCSGGDSAADCFSTRKMFRENGGGEVYLYVDARTQNYDLFCRDDCIASKEYGFSIGRNKFSFKTGVWNVVRQVVHLNSFNGEKPNNDGFVQVFVDGGDKPVIDMRNIVFRNTLDTLPLGIQFETFFGGSGAAYSTPINQTSLFKGFRMGYTSFAFRGEIFYILYGVMMVLLLL